MANNYSPPELRAVSSTSRHNRTPPHIKGRPAATNHPAVPSSTVFLWLRLLFCSLNVSCPRPSKCTPPLPITLALSVAEPLHKGADGAKPLGTVLPNTCALCVFVPTGASLSDYRATHRTGFSTVKSVALHPPPSATAQICSRLHLTRSPNTSRFLVYCSWLMKVCRPVPIRLTRS
jgi:hypothetical protein